MYIPVAMHFVVNALILLFQHREGHQACENCCAWNTEVIPSETSGDPRINPYKTEKCRLDGCV